MELNHGQSNSQSSMGTELVPIALPGAKAFLSRGVGGCVLIDSGIPPALPKLRQSLTELLPGPEALKLILITHMHPDHVSGAKALREQYGAPIAMHRADAGVISAGLKQQLSPRTWLGRMVAPLVNGQAIPEALRFTPDIEIADSGLDLRPYGVEADVIHTPGHTPGSLSVLLAGGPAMVADLIMPRYPAIRWPGMPLFADDPQQVRQSVQHILALQPRLIMCSHGGPFSPEDVARAFSM